MMKPNIVCSAEERKCVPVSWKHITFNAPMHEYGCSRNGCTAHSLNDRSWPPQANVHGHGLLPRIREPNSVDYKQMNPRHSSSVYCNVTVFTIIDIGEVYSIIFCVMMKI